MIHNPKLKRRNRKEVKGEEKGEREEGKNMRRGEGDNREMRLDTT